MSVHSGFDLHKQFIDKNSLMSTHQMQSMQAWTDEAENLPSHKFPQMMVDCRKTDLPGISNLRRATPIFVVLF